MMDRGTVRNIEIYSKNKFEKSVHLVGFIIRLYHDARSTERSYSEWVGTPVHTVQAKRGVKLSPDPKGPTNFSGGLNTYSLLPPSTKVNTATSPLFHMYSCRNTNNLLPTTTRLDTNYQPTGGIANTDVASESTCPMLVGQRYTATVHKFVQMEGGP